MLKQKEAGAYRLEWATKELATFRVEKVKTHVVATGRLHAWLSPSTG